MHDNNYQYVNLDPSLILTSPSALGSAFFELLSGNSAYVSVQFITSIIVFSIEQRHFFQKRQVPAQEYY